jgi:Ca2+-binding EF-hand superfamily protein
MLRAAVLIGALIVSPAIASAQQPCTTDARRVVNELYRHMLERTPDAGSAAWVDKLANGSMTVRDVVRDVAKSPEHLQRFGNEALDQVVGTLYRHILGRQPDPAGQRAFTNLAASQGLGAVVDQIVNSSEYQQTLGDWGVPGSGGVNYCGTGTFSSQNRTQPITGMRYRRMDTNGDGVISRNEWRGTPESFDAQDWNHDGVLSGDEVRVGAIPPATNASAQNYIVGNADRFDYLDVNGNGVIDRNEWDGGMDAFDRLNTNRDGRLSRAESNTGTTGPRASNFNSLDLNHDGRITLNEWPWSHASFDAQDLNGDGCHHAGRVPRRYRRDIREAIPI